MQGDVLWPLEGTAAIGWCPEQESNLHGAFAPRDFTLPRRFPPGADYLFTPMGCRALVGEGYCWDSPR